MAALLDKSRLDVVIAFVARAVLVATVRVSCTNTTVLDSRTNAITTLADAIANTRLTVTLLCTADIRSYRVILTDLATRTTCRTSRCTASTAITIQTDTTATNRVGNACATITLLRSAYIHSYRVILTNLTV